ncbi:MAG: WD40 repeat domain-containing protein, partial [Brevefilum sp.]
FPFPPSPAGIEQAIQTSTRSSFIPASSGDFLLLNRGTTIAIWDLLEDEIKDYPEDYPQPESNTCEQIPDTCQNVSGGFSFQCPEDPAQPPIQSLTITPDDRRMLVSLTSNRSELRTTISGELVWEVDERYTKTLFSLSDQFFLGLRTDGVIEKRDLLDGELVLSLKQHPSRLFDLDFSPDGSLLAAGFDDEWIRIFNTQTGEMLGILDGSANSLKFSPTGDLLAAGLTKGQVRIFELARGRFFDLGRGHLGPVTGLAFSQDEPRLASSSEDCTINKWNITDRYRTNFVIPGRGSPGPILDLQKCAASDQLYASSEFTIFVVEEGSSLPIFSSENENTITDIALETDGHHLAIGGTSLWLLETDPANTLNNPIQVVSSSEGFYRVAFLSDSGLLLGVLPQTISIFSIEENQTPVLLGQTQLTNSLDRPIDLESAPSDDLIAIGAENGLIYIFGIPPKKD